MKSSIRVAAKKQVYRNYYFIKMIFASELTGKKNKNSLISYYKN